jgi:CheY-like chemotaxis protein
MDITKRILERVCYTVRCAVGVAVAKEQMADSMPDGIILNSELPDAEGLGYCREFRKTFPLPILFLSNSKDDELPALKAGATDFLKKPFDYEIFKARVNVLLNTTVSVVPDGNGENGYAEQRKTDESESLAESAIKSRVKRPFFLVAACLAAIVTGLGVFYINGSRHGQPEAPGYGYDDVYETFGYPEYFLLEDPMIPLGGLPSPEYGCEEGGEYCECAEAAD